MDLIRMRPGARLSTAEAATPVQAGGYVDADQNPLLQDRPDVAKALTIAPISNFQTAVGAVKETIIAKAIRGIEYMQIPGEDGFDPGQALGHAGMAQYNESELEFLGDSRSTAELAQRRQQVQTTRENYAAMAANPLTAVAASLFDVDAVIGFGVGKAVSVGRTARAITALSANAAVLGVASRGGDVGVADIIGTSLGVALAAAPRVQRAARAIEGAAEEGGTVAQGAGRTLDAGTSEAATSRVVQAGSEGSPRMAEMPDPDYVVPKPDMAWNKPHVNVAVGTGEQITTTTQNALRAVLNLGDDLPEGVRTLGRALSESLDADADIPLVLRTREASSRSNVSIGPDGSAIETQVFSRAGVAGDLDDAIRGMTTQEKSIVLHEAAHAKTSANIRAWQEGTLPDGAAKDAITRIDQIRQEVQANTTFRQLFSSNESGLNYALRSNDEFISQLFNDARFRTALQSVKVGEQSVWSELVQKVVQAFTGKAAGDSALAATVAEFEKLLSESNNVAKFGPRNMPTMQSEFLQAPKDMRELTDRAWAGISKSTSLYQNLAHISPKGAELAERLVVDATGTNANSATHYARTAELAANVAHAQVDAALRQAMSAQGWSTFSRVRSPQKYLQAQRELSERVYGQLAENHRRFLAGDEVLEHPDPAVQKIVQTFADSKWAEGNLERIRSSGMTGAEDIAASPYYLPRQHSASKVREFVNSGKGVTRADVENMYADQFLRMYEERGMDAAKASQLGKQMLRNMEERADGATGYRQNIAGMQGDDIEFAMRAAGIGDDEIQRFMSGVNKAQGESNTARNLKSRVEFDMTRDFYAANGTAINPQMFVNKDVNHLMEGYSRNMSGRIGLAKAGFPDLRDVLKAVDEVVDSAPDTRAAKSARETLDNTVNQLLGYPTGERAPDTVRSISILSGAEALANSGLFQLADVGMMFKEYGTMKTLKAMTRTKFGRKALEVAQSPEYGSRLRDVLESRNVLSGRYRSVLTHLDDNTDIGSMHVFNSTVQQAGQSTRFVNGMEYVRRGQSKIAAGLIGDTLDDAIKGNAEALQQMRKFGLTDELAAKAKAALDQNPDLRSWPSDIRFDLETVGQNAADSIVLENRLGEIPAWMQFSALGKVFLPYMTFVAGSWNKLLMRSWVNEGAKGVALMFAYQLPLTTLTTVAAMAVQGKDLNAKDVALQTLENVPLLSWFGYALGFLTNGPSSSIAALGSIDKLHAAISGIVNGDASAEQIVKAVPFLSILPGARAAGIAIDEAADED